MDPKVNYTAVGLFVVILTMALIAFVFWLSVERHKTYHRYLIYMKETVSGLNPQSPVKFNGVDVGYVEKIEIDPEDPQQVRLIAKIVKGTPITTSTVATLMTQGITGVTYVGLKAKTSKAPPLRRQDGEPYPVIPTEPSLLVQLNEALRDVSTGLRGISDTFRSVFNQQNLNSIGNILNKTSIASEQFPDAMKKLSGAAQSLTLASNQAKDTLENAKGTLSQATDTFQKVKVTLQESNVAIKSLVQQTLPEIYQAANYMKQTFSNLKSVSSDIKQNPAIIVRGKQPAPPGPGE